MIVRTRVADISTIGRNTQGVKLVDLKDGDTVVSVTLVSADDDDEDAVAAAASEEEEE
jgi:DNA gyrase subunit A